MSVELHGEPLEWWMGLDWWPKGVRADVTGGGAGHEREIVVNLDGYTGEVPWDEASRNVPDLFVDALKLLLSDGWQIQSRGSRVELHPSGRFAGGFTREDSLAVQKVLLDLGCRIGYVHPEGRGLPEEIAREAMEKVGLGLPITTRTLVMMQTEGMRAVAERFGVPYALVRIDNLRVDLQGSGVEFDRVYVEMPRPSNG